MTLKDIKILVNGSEDKATLTIASKKITFQYNNYIISNKGDYPFFVLKEMRKILEETNIFLLINGSRKDVYPSGLSLMGNNAYIQIMGKPADLNDLVDIFSETDRIELVGNVEDQIKYHNEWIYSISGYVL